MNLCITIDKCSSFHLLVIHFDFIISNKYPKFIQAKIKTNYMFVLSDLVKTPAFTCNCWNAQRRLYFPCSQQLEYHISSHFFAKTSDSLMLFENTVHVLFHFGVFSTFYIILRIFLLGLLGFDVRDSLDWLLTGDSTSITIRSNKRMNLSTSL